MDSALPEHRAAFASRLRKLRHECGEPPYRAMSALAHCSFASLSSAAAGRRLPSWETTRGYVTACLRHADRAAEIDTVLPRWHHAWEVASARDKSYRPPPPMPEPAPPPTRVAPRRAWRGAAVPAALVALALLTMATMAGAAARPPAPAPMNGLFNVLVVPFRGLSALEATLARDLTQWAGAEPIVAVRGPSGVRPVAPDLLAHAGAEHGADVVLTGGLRMAGDLWTLTIDVVLTDRLFSETPELVGRHEINLTEPADVIRGNLEVNRQLIGDAVRYVQAVVSFVRGLGRYALDDYPGAEHYFRTADTGFSALRNAIRAEVVLLMLGNAVGRTARYAEAARVFQRALTANPGYARAKIGLAEALRAGSARDPAGLRQALGLYESALAVPASMLQQMKARLGLGLTYQSLSRLHDGDHWAAADAEYAAVLRAQAIAGLRGETGRQAMRLAAEARAGQALTAWSSQRYDRAAVAYEEALGLLSRIGVDRPTIRDREQIFLHNLRDVYAASGAAAQARDVEARIRRTGG
ncbi:hypothetical protein [Mangrovihabitans endophyticus]|uniref:Tetratricopeptide repeat-containing protein n=1 Tax=Mangrovihabitans endophyticus TaxID=1751298 RepID=A0A8J3BXJ9_9ACTN|nr:hypothetical protein [Mangrovihabitans endophyticus]GGK78615.1 hypothetical protein GCM10012284_10650 [Mangrovihabitans endophyticus]